MADSNDHDDENERNYQALLHLAEIRQASERQRRVKQLMGRIGKSRHFVLDHRTRLIQDTMMLRKDMSEVEATDWVDGVLGLEPRN